MDALFAVFDQAFDDANAARVSAPQASEAKPTIIHPTAKHPWQAPIPKPSHETEYEEPQQIELTGNHPRCDSCQKDFAYGLYRVHYANRKIAPAMMALCATCGLTLVDLRVSEMKREVIRSSDGRERMEERFIKRQLYLKVTLVSEFKSREYRHNDWAWAAQHPSPRPTRRRSSSSPAPQREDEIITVSEAEAESLFNAF